MQPAVFSDGTLIRTWSSQLLVLVATLAWATASADIPRTTSGKPDLSGYYDGGTRTPVERPRGLGDREFMTADEAKRIGTGTEFLDDGRSNDPNRPPPKKGGDGINAFGAGNVGGYNAFWLDPGSGVEPIDGKYPTSIIYDPPNGREPRMTMKGYAKKADNFSSFTHHNDGTASWLDKPGAGPFDGPEELALAERCLLGFSAGPPLLPGVYNNHKRIVQTEDHVMILAEMVHDARIVRLNDDHGPEDMRRWLGDAVGHWEGDTLVVETTNFREDTGLYGGDANLDLEERFTLLEDGNLLYHFTVNDPTAWTAPWSGRYVWKKSEQPVYEYACHEGNYSMFGILKGARRMEREELARRASAGAD